MNNISDVDNLDVIDNTDVAIVDDFKAIAQVILELFRDCAIWAKTILYTENLKQHYWAHFDVISMYVYMLYPNLFDGK